ncbi:MAG: hypothetical protein ABWY36_00185 [Leifsonia sp.]
MGSPDEALRLWTTVLDRLETEALEAVSDPESDDQVSLPPAPAHEPEAWTHGADLGVLPHELAARAAAVVALQREMLGLLALERQSVRRHLDAVRAVPDSGAPISVYLDVEG